MINPRWLKVSLFLPIYGTVINCLIIFVRHAKYKEYSAKQLILAFVICSLAFLVSMLACAIVFKIVSQIVAVRIDVSLKLIVSCIVSGLIMNAAFAQYYVKVLMN